MNKLIIISTLSILFFATAQMCGCGSCKAEATPKVQSGVNEPKTLRLKISGVTCAGCSNNVSKALKNHQGILEQKVEYPGDLAVIKYNSSKTSPADIITAIEKAGYKAVEVK
ncbi:MAG TPA: heavy-metal-associated domain-containing protein [Sphingobacteriaceae bacterium]|nr:heavy-metal-associated domain-containing protein [Sphingobacteriaceae bacterium]